jgi:hypothetical protein
MRRFHTQARRDPLALSGPLAGISFIAGIGGSMARADSPYPRPWATPSQVRTYFTENAGAARLSAAGQFISTICLARFTTSVARLAGSRGLRTAAVAGGAVATGSLATSALCSAGLSGRWGRQEDSAARLHRLGFRAGGPVHGAGFGLLCGALGVAGSRTGQLPRAVAVTALASAGAGLLAPLYFVAPKAAWFIPAARFPGLIVCAIAGVRLSRVTG